MILSATTSPTRPMPPASAKSPERSTPRPATSAHAQVNRALSRASREVLLCSDLSGGPGDPITMFRGLDRENLRRGVRYRVLFPDHARINPMIAKQLGVLVASGADVRTTAHVPASALVIDGTIGFLPGAPHNGVAVLRLPSMLRTVTELFDQVWPSAVALSTHDSGENTELTERERELLTLLMAGHTDESVGAELGISVRTVRRIVAGIMNRLGARSRFQAGAKAVGRGWLAERAS